MYTEDEIDVLFRDSCRITLDEVRKITKDHVTTHPDIEEVSHIILDSLHKCVNGNLELAAEGMHRLQDAVDQASQCECEENKHLHGFFKDTSKAFDKGARHLNSTITKRIFADYNMSELEAKLIFLAVQNGMGVIHLTEILNDFGYQKRTDPIPEIVLDVPNDLSLEKEFDDPTLPE